MPQLKLAIFDLDGTLVDSLPDIVDGTNYMLGQLGRRPIGADVIRGLVGAGARRLIEGALAAAQPAVSGSVSSRPEEIERGIELYVHYNHDHIDNKSRLYPGVAETLKKLHTAGIQLVLVSNKNVALCRRALESFGVGHFFAAILGGDSLKERKPSPEPLFHAMTEVGFSRKIAPLTAMVGDSRYDVEAGKAAGVVTVGCTYGYGVRSEVEQADYRIDRFGDLLLVPGF